MNQIPIDGVKSTSKVGNTLQSARELLEDGQKTFKEVFKELDCNESVMAKAIKSFSKMKGIFVQDNAITAKLNELFCRTGMFIVQITGIEDVSEDEDNMLFELLARLRKQYEMLWKTMFIRFTLRHDEEGVTGGCPSKSLDAFVVNHLGISDSTETRRVAGTLLEEHAGYSLKHPLYDVISRKLHDDSDILTLVLTEIYSPFLQICHYLQELLLLSTDLRSILQLGIAIETFFAHLDCFQNRWLDMSISEAKSCISTPEPVSDNIATEISALFNSTSSVGETIAKMPKEEKVTFHEKPCEPTNLLPFDLMISLYSQIPIALHVNSSSNQTTTEFQSVTDVPAWFMIHALQGHFQGAFLSLINDRMQMLLEIIKDTPEKPQDCEAKADGQEYSRSTPDFPELLELVNKYCATDSNGKASRIKSSVQPIIDFTQKKFSQLWRHDAESNAGSEKNDCSEREKRWKRLFGESTEHMHSILFSTCLEASRSPYFSQAAAYVDKQESYLKVESPVITDTKVTSIEISETLNRLYSLPLIREFASKDEFDDAEANAAKECKKTVIQQSPQFFMNLKRQIDEIYADAHADTAM
ncbi:hypothetical protein XU18_4993 [Perkinsela sp. CCAP 1560/4]|nr:hypothetical protein XU18_4993 [Perkinsela sp. CCAP 1560/4]|eukprot:KNH03653.1 hypothetical protein XU18_4993 [Perkinsela sp. CCAP 1560/4]